MLLLLDANSSGVSISSLTAYTERERWAFREQRIRDENQRLASEIDSVSQGIQSAEISWRRCGRDHRCACRAASRDGLRNCVGPFAAGGNLHRHHCRFPDLCFGWFLDSNWRPHRGLCSGCLRHRGKARFGRPVYVHFDGGRPASARR